jgi:hypothetical protein
MAHVYGTPGAYQISTAGHCGKVGTIATVVAAVGNHNGAAEPILLDFGKFSQRQENGIGQDWALISIQSPFQGLVSPTMCVWAGPRGAFTAQGDLVSVQMPRRLPGTPTVSTDPDAALAPGVDVVHYGHGVGLGGPGVGTARTGGSVTWTSTYFGFVGAISPGDSGSGANTVTGEAAGIITHLVVDPLLRTGIANAAGTRVTQVPAQLADGQLVPYPAPVPGAP